MSTTKEFMLAAAGLIITVSLIFVSMNIFKKAINIGNEVVRIEEESLKRVRENELLMYDGIEVSGNKAISYINVNAKNYGEEMLVYVNNLNSSGELVYKVSELLTLSELRKTDSKYYINPLKLYSVNVYRDENEAVNKILIKQAN